MLLVAHHARGLTTGDVSYQHTKPHFDYGTRPRARRLQLGVGPDLTSFIPTIVRMRTTFHIVSRAPAGLRVCHCGGPKKLATRHRHHLPLCELPPWA